MMIYAVCTKLMSISINVCLYVLCGVAELCVNAGYVRVRVCESCLCAFVRYIAFVRACAVMCGMVVMMLINNGIYTVCTYKKNR
jgi:hypothetical protein